MAAAANKKKDPLVLLREHTIASKKVYLTDDYLEFDGRRVHRDAKCGFRFSAKDPLIDIGSVYYMYRETSADRSYSETTAKRRGFTYIGVAFRTGLCEYLAGVVKDCPGLVIDVIEGRKRPREDVAAESRASKAHKGEKTDAERPIAAGVAITVEDISHADVAARVRPVKDLDVLVRCPGRKVPNADLILKIAQDEVRNWYAIGNEAKEKDKKTWQRTPLKTELIEMVRKDPEKRPIILVPCNKNAPLNLLNAQALLQDGKYLKPDDQNTRFFESTRPESVDVARNCGGRPWRFEVRDNARHFTRAEWLRTVAVISDGTDWQFKGWPFETIVDLFATIKGVFLLAHGTQTPEHVHKWSVDIIPLAAPHLEHRFAETRDKFFHMLEAFMDSYRPRKFSQQTVYAPERRKIEKPKPVL